MRTAAKELRRLAGPSEVGRSLYLKPKDVAALRRLASAPDGEGVAALLDAAQYEKLPAAARELTVLAAGLAADETAQLRMAGWLKKDLPPSFRCAVVRGLLLKKPGMAEINCHFSTVLVYPKYEAESALRLGAVASPAVAELLLKEFTKPWPEDWDSTKTKREEVGTRVALGLALLRTPAVSGRVESYVLKLLDSDRPILKFLALGTWLPHTNTRRVVDDLTKRAEAGDFSVLRCLARQDLPDAARKAMLLSRKLVGKAREQYLGLIIRALGENRAVPAEVDAFLIEMLKTEPYWPARSAAARALAERHPLRARAALQEALKIEKSAEVRKDIAKALARFKERAAERKETPPEQF